MHISFTTKTGGLFLVACLLTISSLLAQGIRGRVTDKNSGAAIPGATVVVVGTNTGATTDANGNYQIKVAAGNYSIATSFVGYKTTTQPAAVPATGDVEINTTLAESTDNLSEVVIIGSRAATARTNVQTVAPVDVITAKEMKSFSQIDVGQILNFVAPSFNSNRQTVADGTDHVDPASLRGLGPDQVLVLVNGKRRHTSALLNINGTVGRGSVGTDMNVIPVAAIERIEVLRDGAAAQYGSDAIAGVINVVLKKDYTGLTASLTGGQNMTNLSYNVPVLGGGSRNISQSITDGQVLQFDVSKGFRLGQRGYLTVSGQYNDRGRSNRSGYDNAPTIYLGASGGFPGTPTGQVQNDFRTKLIADDATLVQQRGYNRQNMIIGNSASQNVGVFINGSLPVGNVSEVYAAGGVTYRKGTGYGNNRIPVSRAQQPLTADGSLYYPDGFLPGIGSTVQDQSLIAGFKTKLGSLTMDLSNTYGHNSFAFSVFNSGNASLPNNSSPQTTFDAGKLNFTQNTVNLDFSRLFTKPGPFSSVNLAFGAEARFENYAITAGEPNSYIGGDLKKSVPAAPLLISGPANGTALALPGSQVFPGFQPTDAIDKSRTSQSLYVDVESEIGKLLVDLAGRFENYSDFGSTINGKVAARYGILEGINLRAAISTGFRAPSLHQRYFQNTSTQFVSGNPSNTLTVNNENPIARTFIGVDALKPETSVNMTVGATAKFGRFSATIDAYQIDITNRIVYSGAFSRALLGFGANDYVGVNNVNFFANAANTRTRGIDIVLNERLNVGSGTLTLTGAVNFNKNEVTAINSTPLIDDPKQNEASGRSPDQWFRTLLFDRQQRSRIEVFQPQNKLNLSASYSIGKFDITARTVRFGEIRYIHNVDPTVKKADGTYWNTQFARDADGNAFIDQTFNPVWITDLVLGYRLNKMLNISIGANNIFDVYPDQIYIDPRNAPGSIDYNSGRDASNRGRLLYQPNQGGYNGRFVFGRVTVSL
ncbi:TonB-dependent receptor [Fibrella sp. HMF5335]|uniref:TonB-dependent receptor n=1 Tax=Fibrella rubiginis TaxID=2817060 RepID=A0A939K4F9_9BACT|nr:TonB-dependent receptor [Fibrella rubiginis]MBO0936668.1 TonB-dependent receptor [Fibrella rubiginis]